MPQEWTKKDERQYEHIRESQKDRGSSAKRAKEVAARTVNKERAQSGRAKQPSKTFTEDKSPGQRGGERSGTNRPKGRTKEQLYEEAKKRGIQGRSKMTKSQLQSALGGKKKSS